MFDKTKFMSFYKGDPCEQDASKMYDAIERAFKSFPCPCCGQTMATVNPMLMMGALATARIELGGKDRMYYVNKREIISEEKANANYGGRYGNTNIGDGYKYRASGPVGLTFKDNYVYIAKAINDYSIIENPDKLTTDLDTGAKSLVAYFRWKNADLASIAGDWKKVRILVNGIDPQTNLPNGWFEFKRVIDNFSK